MMIQDFNVFTVLGSLSAKEIKDFGKFLNSPYFRKNQNQLRLFDLLRKYFPKNKSGVPENEQLFNMVYPGKVFVSSTMRNLYSDLNEKLLEFLSIDSFRKSEIEMKRHLRGSLVKKNLKSEFIKSRSKETGQTGADCNYFLNNHFLENFNFNFAMTNQKVTKRMNLESELECLESSVKYLYLFYFTEITQHYITMLILRKNYDHVEIPRALEAQLGALSKITEIILPGDKYYYIKELYSNLIKMYTETNNTAHYYAYKTSFIKHAQKLSGDERCMHISNLSSYSTGKVLEGITEFNHEFFELIEFNMANKYYVDSKTEHLPHELFRNYFLHGIKMKKYDWTEDFIYDNYMNVHPDDTENMFNLGFAYLNFEKGDFESALRNINLITTDFFIFKLDVKNLTLRIFYELGYIEEALCLIKTYYENLRTSRLISPERKKRYYSFVKLTENLLLYRLDNSKIDAGYLKYRIRKHPAIAYKSWLEEKASILENKQRKSA